jgi:hypothetical protein
MIDRHHSLRKFFGNDRVEAFRKGDLVDFSLGLIRFGLPHAFVSEVKAAFPNAGFHKHLIKVAGRWTVHHPLNPIPVLRW